MGGSNGADLKKEKTKGKTDELDEFDESDDVARCRRGETPRPGREEDTVTTAPIGWGEERAGTRPGRPR